MDVPEELNETVLPQKCRSAHTRCDFFWLSAFVRTRTPMRFCVRSAQPFRARPRPLSFGTLRRPFLRHWIRSGAWDKTLRSATARGTAPVREIPSAARHAVSTPRRPSCSTFEQNAWTFVLNCDPDHGQHRGLQFRLKDEVPRLSYFDDPRCHRFRRRH